LPTPEHREVAEILLRRAQDDLRAARVLHATEDQSDNIIGFHLQQATEKALKSALAIAGIEIPHTHDLSYLAELLEQAEIEVPDAIQRAGWLSAWGVTFRYEDADDLNRDAAFEAATEAIALAEEVLAERGSG
jgi:HEPN domain-containing protein